jgi:hypothetical protein
MTMRWRVAVAVSFSVLPLIHCRSVKSELTAREKVDRPITVVRAGEQLVIEWWIDQNVQPPPEIFLMEVTGSPRCVGHLVADRDRLSIYTPTADARFDIEPTVLRSGHYTPIANHDVESGNPETIEYWLPGGDPIATVAATVKASHEPQQGFGDCPLTPIDP